MIKVNILTDEELLELFEQDNVLAFEEIYNRYWLKLYSSAFKRLKDREAAQEIVQEFFTTFWINRSRIKIRSTLQGYLFSSIRYLVLNFKRAEHVRASYAEILVIVNNKTQNSTEEYIGYKELKDCIDTGINQLPPKCRSVFELSRQQYKSNKEIAQLLDISEKTVENHISRAIRQLRVNIDVFLIFLFLFLH